MTHLRDPNPVLQGLEHLVCVLESDLGLVGNVGQFDDLCVRRFVLFAELHNFVLEKRRSKNLTNALNIAEISEFSPSIARQDSLVEVETVSRLRVSRRIRS